MLVGIGGGRPRVVWRLLRFLELEQYHIADRQVSFYASSELGRAEVSFGDYAQDGARGHARFLSAGATAAVHLRAAWEGEPAQVKKLFYWFEKV